MNVAGSLIKDARLQTGLTQRQLAERAHTTQSTIAAYETGRKTPSISTLMRVLGAAGLELRMRLAPVDRDDETVRRYELSWPAEVRERFRREQLELIDGVRQGIGAVIEPPSLDPRGILEVLERNEVDYVVIGGLGAQLHGAAIQRTYDMDITPARSVENLRRLAAALRELGAKLRPPGMEEGFEIEIDERTFLNMATITFTTRHGWLDVSLIPDRTTGYEDLARGRSVINAFDLAVPVCGLEDIIRSKQAAGRPKDIVHIPVLRERLIEITKGAGPG